MPRYPRTVVTRSDLVLDDASQIAGEASPAGALPSVSRRQVLHGMLAASAASLLGAASMRVLAQTPVTSPDAALTSFMDLSKALTGRTTLDGTVGTRLFAAVGHGQPAFPAALPALAASLNTGDLDAGQQQLALRIMEGWYLGVVDDVVITYEQALMFDVVSDTLVIRSYAPGKPGFWAQKPNEKNA